MKPPVEAPTSRQSRPAGSTPNASSAWASFSPPRETNRGPALDARARPPRPPARRPSSARARARRGQRLRLRAALREPALDEEDVESLLHAGLGRADGEPVDDLGEHRRCRRDLQRAARARARRRGWRAPGPPSTPSVRTKPSPSRMSSTIWKSSPSSSPKSRHGPCSTRAEARRPERHARPTRRRGSPSSAGGRVSRSVPGSIVSRYWPPIIPSVASRQLARDVGVGYEQASRNASASSASPASTAFPSPYAAQTLGLPAPLGVVVERGQVVVDEREVVHELERERRGHHLLRLGLERLADGERDHRPDPLAAHLDERVARRVALAVELGPQLELLERLLDELLQLLRRVHRPPASPGRSASIRSLAAASNSARRSIACSRSAAPRPAAQLLQPLHLLLDPCSGRRAGTSAPGRLRRASRSSAAHAVSGSSRAVRGSRSRAAPRPRTRTASPG